MNNRNKAFAGFFSRWNIVSLSAVICISAWLNFRGISAGLPSRERFKLSPGSKENVKKIIPEITAFRNRKNIHRTEFLDKSKRQNFIELARFSPYFDSLRSINPDEFYILKTLAGMAARKSIHPDSYIYGPFFVYQIGASLAVSRITGCLPGESGLNHYLMNPEEFIPFYLSGRIMCAVYGTLAVLITFLTGYRLGKTAMAVFASAFLAFMPLVALASKFIKADTPTLFWSSLVLLFALPILERAELRDYILTGLFIGLAGACKYSAVFTASYPVMFHLLRKSDCFKKQNFSIKDFCTREELMLITAGSISFAAFILVCPSFVMRNADFIRDLNWIAGVSRPGNILYNMFTTFVCFCYDSMFYTLGLPGFIAIAAGLIYVVIKPEKVWLGMLPAVILFLFLTSKGLPNSDAYLMPAFVPLALMAGRAVLAPRKKWLCIIIAPAVLISNFSYAHAWNNTLVAGNSRISAMKWIDANIKPGSSIATLRYPVFYRAPAVNPVKYRLLNEQIDGGKALEADYYLHSSFQWRVPGMLGYITGESPEVIPEGFGKMIEFENFPQPYFGVLQLKRTHRLNLYFEVAAPKIILYGKLKL